MLKFLICLTLITLAWSVCDQCHTTNPIACHSERKYSLCVKGIPSNDYIFCPYDHVCTAESRICVPKLEGKAPSCPSIDTASRCGICSKQKRVFSCMNVTTIAFCFGKDNPDYSAIAYCPMRTVCDLDNENDFCSYEDEAEPSCKDELTTVKTDGDIPTTTTELITTTTKKESTTTTTTEKTTTTEQSPTTKDEETTTTEESTMTAEDTTTTTEESTTEEDSITEDLTTTTLEDSTTSTTPSTPRDPMTFCRERDETGSFKPDGDTECRIFILCYESNNKLYGLCRDCPAGEYFNDKLATCSADKPAHCVTTDNPINCKTKYP